MVVVDIPLAALRIALERAAADGQSERCGVVAADGAALPFERLANPYRTGGAVVAMSALASRLVVGRNVLTITLG